MNDKNNLYTTDINTVIVGFAMQPIIKNHNESIDSIEKLGFLLLDKANTLKIKNQSGALMSVIYIVSMVHGIEPLIEESMMRMSRHPQKEVREFVTKDLFSILPILPGYKIIDKHSDIIYFNFIIKFLNKLGIDNVIDELNKPIMQNKKS